MNNLTITQRAILKRRHGITVRIESQGVAKVTHSDGREAEYAIEHLKECAKPSITWRLRQWILGGVA